MPHFKPDGPKIKRESSHAPSAEMQALASELSDAIGASIYIHRPKARKNHNGAQLEVRYKDGANEWISTEPGTFTHRDAMRWMQGALWLIGKTRA